jgi:hypothetical protein
MIRRGDLDGRPPGLGAWPFLAVSEMNGQHAPPHPRATMKVAPTDGDGLLLG